MTAPRVREPLTATTVTAGQVADLARACGGSAVAALAVPIVAGWRAVLDEIVTGDDAVRARHTVERIEVGRPPGTGERCTVEGTVTGRFRHGTGDGLAVLLDITGSEGRRVARVESVLQVPDRPPERFGRPSSPAPKVTAGGPAVASGTVAFTAAQVGDYCRATGDRFGLHLDPVAARAAGFDSPVVPGQLVLLHLAEAVARAEALGRGRVGWVAAVGARFSRPVLVGQTLTWSVLPTERPATWAIQADVPTGRALKAATVEASEESS